MIEGIKLVEPLTLDDLKAQHMIAIQIAGDITGRFRVIANDGYRYRAEDEHALFIATENEMLIRQALLSHVPADKEEARDKVMYLSAFLLAGKIAFDETCLKNLSASLIGF